MWISLICAVCVSVGFAGGDGDDLPWDPFRLRIQLSPEASEAFRNDGSLPQGLVPGALDSGLPQLDSLNHRHGATRVRQVFQPRPGFEERHRAFGLDRWVEIQFAEPRAILALQSEYAAADGIAWAEPVYRKVSFDNAFPDDPRFGEQWALRNTGQNDGTPGADISMDEAWALSTGDPSVVVLVVDSGIALTHPDLVNSLWVNSTPGPENGYDGDLHGWNFVDGNADLADGSGHGTQVAGIIAASTHNEIGIAGVAGGSGAGDGVRLMIAKTFNATGGGGFAEALVYGADNGAVIASNSWGYTEPDVFEEVILDAIDYFIATAGMDAQGQLVGPIQGGVVVFAAGNSSSEERFYPAAYTPVVAVAGTDRNDQKASFSTYGEWIDLSAPGAGILTTHRNGNYTSVNGTSFACPHVSGVAALLASRFSGISNLQLIDRMLATTDPIDAVNSAYAGLLGSGRLNAARALDDDMLNPPAAIDDLSVSGVSQTEVSLQWTAPGSSGMSGQAAAYDLRYATTPIDDENFAEAIRLAEVPAPAMAGTVETFTVTGLETETTYWFAVRSSDFFANDSALSNLATATTWALPDASLTPAVLEKAIETGTQSTTELVLANNGAGPLVFELDSDSTPDWLSVEPAAGMVAAGETLTLNLVINAAGLANGAYSASLVLHSNDPNHSALTVAVSLTVTGGVAEMTVEPLALDFGDVFVGFPQTLATTISNPGTDVLTVSTLDLVGAGFAMDAEAPLTIAAGAGTAVNISFNPSGEGVYAGSLTLGGDLPDSEPLTVQLSGNALLPPIAYVDPLTIERTLAFDSTETVVVAVGNTGGVDLSYSVQLIPAVAAEAGGAEPLVMLSGLESHLSAEEALAARQYPVDLIHDDGSAEDGIGLTSGGEFIWLNQFTLAAESYPFILKQTAVYFPGGNDIAVDKTFDLYVYAADAAEPGASTTLLQRVENAVITAVDDWTYVNLPAPVYFSEASDVLIGVVNREAGLNGFPAAIDLNGGSQERSWIGTYDGAVPDEPTFPASGIWGLIDDFEFSGNWLVRGYGHRDFVRLENGSGMLAAGETDSFILIFEPRDLLAGNYYYTLVIETNDPAQPLIEVPVTLTVTGEPKINIQPNALEFGAIMVNTSKALVLEIRNEGIATLEVLTADVSDAAFAIDFEPFALAPGTKGSLEVAFAPDAVGVFDAELTLVSNDPVTPARIVSLSGESVPPPSVRLDPSSLALELSRVETVLLNATLFNDGLGPLHYSLSREATLLPEGVFTIPIALPGLPVLDFILDDGAAEDGLGFNDGLQFLWANQFTPEPGDAPLLLERVEVLFDIWSQTMVGDALDIHIYHVADGNPAEGATRIYSMLNQTVQSLEDWSVYALEQPLLIEQVGDILVGVVFREPLFSGWPATIDSSSPSQQRSWIGVYYGDPPQLPELPAADYWGLLDDLGYPGNWMIRAHGTRAFASVEPASGSLEPESSTALAIEVSGIGLLPGEYGINLMVESNDPQQPQLALPIAITITGAQALTLTSEVVDFGQVREDQTSSLPVVLTNSGADPLVIESVAVDNTAFVLSGDSMPLSLAAGESVELMLTLAHATVEVLSAALTVVSDDPKQSLQVVAINAEIVPAPALSWDGEVETMIETDAGLSGSVSLSVTNSGGSPLHYVIRSAAAGADADPYGYRWRSNQIEESIPYRWIDARDEGVELTGLTGTPDGNQLVTLPFDFPFYGGLAGQARVSVNGWLTFGDFSAGGWTPRALPDTREPTHIVAPFWDDLSLMDGGSVHVLHVEGADPHWIVQWSDVRRMSAADARLTFQVALWPSGLIEFRYESMLNSGEAVSIGIADAGGERGLQVAYAEAFVADGLLVRLLAEAPLVGNLPLTGSIAPGETGQIEIPYATNGLFAGHYLQDLVLEFNDPGATGVWLPLEWSLSGQPEMGVDPLLLDFATVAVGSLSVLDLVINNIGSERLIVSDLGISDAVFSHAAPLPFAIEAGAYLILPVQFSPTAEGEYSAQLLINSDAVNHPQRTVFLRGNALYEAAVPTGQRLLPDWYMPGKALSEVNHQAVQLHITPDETTAAYAVEDSPPAGWTVVVESISEGGSYDAVTGKVKFGPFFDNVQRTLSYDLMAPLEASGEVLFDGVVAVDGLTRPLAGDSHLFFDTRHPADDSEEGFVMSAGAVTGYGAAWRNHQSWPRPPQTIPIAYVTQAGALWRQGEAYQYDPAVGEAPLWWIAAVGAEPLAGMLDVSSASASAVGPAVYYPGEPLDFSIEVLPGAGFLSYAVEELIPSGWAVDANALSHSGSYHAPSGTLRFGPFLDAEPRTLTYTLTPGEDARGEVALAGVLSYNGLTTATGGRRMLSSPPASFAEWTTLMGLSSAAAAPDADPEGTGLANLLRYALAMDLDGMRAERLPQLRVFAAEGDGPARPGLRFLMSSTADDVSLGVEISDDLLDWTPLPESAVHWEMGLPQQGLREVRVQDLQATPGDPPVRFYRLRVKPIEDE